MAAAIGQSCDIPIVLRTLASNFYRHAPSSIPIPFDLQLYLGLDAGCHRDGPACPAPSYHLDWWNGPPRKGLTAKLLSFDTLNECLQHHENVFSNSAQVAATVPLSEPDGMDAFPDSPVVAATVPLSEPDGMDAFPDSPVVAATVPLSEPDGMDAFPDSPEVAATVPLSEPDGMDAFPDSPEVAATVSEPNGVDALSNSPQEAARWVKPVETVMEQMAKNPNTENAPEQTEEPEAADLPDAPKRAENNDETERNESSPMPSEADGMDAYADDEYNSSSPMPSEAEPDGMTAYLSDAGSDSEAHVLPPVHSEQFTHHTSPLLTCTLVTQMSLGPLAATQRQTLPMSPWVTQMRISLGMMSSCRGFFFVISLFCCIFSQFLVSNITYK
jgi:hypothetical protein